MCTHDVKIFLHKILGRGFKTEADMVEFLTRNDSKGTSEFLGGITFHNPFPSAEDLPANITYSIRLKASQRNYPNSQYSNLTGQSSRWYTDKLFPLIALPGPREKTDTWGGDPGKNTMSNCFLGTLVFGNVIHFLLFQSCSFSRNL